MRTVSIVLFLSLLTVHDGVGQSEIDGSSLYESDREMCGKGRSPDADVPSGYELKQVCIDVPSRCDAASLIRALSNHGRSSWFIGTEIGHRSPRVSEYSVNPMTFSNTGKAASLREPASAPGALWTTSPPRPFSHPRRRCLPAQAGPMVCVPH